MGITVTDLLLKSHCEKQLFKHWNSWCEIKKQYLSRLHLYGVLASDCACTVINVQRDDTGENIATSRFKGKNMANVQKNGRYLSFFTSVSSLLSYKTLCGISAATLRSFTPLTGERSAIHCNWLHVWQLLEGLFFHEPNCVSTQVLIFKAAGS